MPKIVDRDAMRLRILTAALQTYSAHGLHAAKMTDIATAAGLAKGTLYLYFDSKQALTAALVRWLFQRIEQQIMPQDDAKTLAEFIQQIRAALDVPETARMETRLFFEVFGPGFGTHDVVDEVADFFNRVGENMAAQLQDLITAGEVRIDINPQAMGRSIAAMIDGMVTHRALFGLTDATFETMMLAMLDLVKTGLKP